jgi:hypothetical protein
MSETIPYFWQLEEIAECVIFAFNTLDATVSLLHETHGPIIYQNGRPILLEMYMSLTIFYLN